MATEEKKTPIYFTDIKCIDELDMIEKIISYYSLTLCLRGKKKTILSGVLIKVLSVYFKYGYNDESKQLIQDMFGYNGRLSVNAHNFKLVKDGYLVESSMSNRIKDINDDLKTIKRYFDGTDSSDKYLFLLRFIKEV